MKSGPRMFCVFHDQLHLKADSLPQLFGILCEQMHLVLRVPATPTIDALRSLWAARKVAQDVVLPGSIPYALCLYADLVSSGVLQL